jgi:hypothetical protein
MVLSSNLPPLINTTIDHPWKYKDSKLVVDPNLWVFGVNGGIVHGREFESLIQVFNHPLHTSRIHTAITLYPAIRTPISCMDPRLVDGLFLVWIWGDTSLAATMVRWCEAGVNQGLLPMTISEEESNLLLNSDEGQGQWSITGYCYTVNGERQKKKKKVNPSGYRTLRKLLGKVAKR